MKRSGPHCLGTADGLQVEVLPFGARIAAIRLPGKNAVLSLVLGYSHWQAFEADPFFLGATIGRVSGRIGGARFSIGSDDFALPRNDGRNHLHGGSIGFHARDWAVVCYENGTQPLLVLGLVSPPGDAGYPGQLEVTATFRLNTRGLQVEYCALADALTPVSLTAHPYFNLSGDPSTSILDHELQMPSSTILVVDEGLVATGETLDVSGTAFDFRTRRMIGINPRARHPQIEIAGGYDHTYILDSPDSAVVRLRSPISGVEMALRSNQPGVQLYTGQHLASNDAATWGPRCGVCLEPQQLPNAVNIPRFPSILVEPGKVYRCSISYEFDVKA